MNVNTLKLLNKEYCYEFCYGIFGCYEYDGGSQEKISEIFDNGNEPFSGKCTTGKTQNHFQSQKLSTLSQTITIRQIREIHPSIWFPAGEGPGAKGIRPMCAEACIGRAEETGKFFQAWSREHICKSLRINACKNPWTSGFHHRDWPGVHFPLDLTAC